DAGAQEAMGLGGVRVGERQEQAGRLRGLLSDERADPQREDRARQRRPRRRQPARQPLRPRALRAARRPVQEMSAAASAGPLYKPAGALEFFKAGGHPERIPAGKVIFTEGGKGLIARHRMYLLISGEVDLLSKKKVIATLKAGELFGELAAIDGAPRTASAMA